MDIRNLWQRPKLSGVAAFGLFLGNAQLALAQDGTAEGLGAMEFFYWGIAFVGSIVALVFAFRFYKEMLAADEGNPTMIEIAGHVTERSGPSDGLGCRSCPPQGHIYRFP